MSFPKITTMCGTHGCVKLAVWSYAQTTYCRKHHEHALENDGAYSAKIDTWLSANTHILDAKQAVLAAQTVLSEAKTERKLMWIGEVRANEPFLTEVLRNRIRATKATKRRLSAFLNIAQKHYAFRDAVLQRALRIREESEARIRELEALDDSKRVLTNDEIPEFVDKWITDVMAENRIDNYNGLLAHFGPDSVVSVAEDATVLYFTTDMLTAITLTTEQVNYTMLSNEVRVNIRTRHHVRDPEGGINLRAFAADNESVHRSSVMTTTETAIHRLLEIPVSATQNTLKEFNAALDVLCENPFADRSLIAYVREQFETDYASAMSFGVRYGAVADSVWGYIQDQDKESRESLIRRLMEEIIDSLDICQMGKMTRLVNVLSGFHSDIGYIAPQMEIFRGRFALLIHRPVAERATGAKDLFEEFGIVEAEQGAWLEALYD